MFMPPEVLRTIVEGLVRNAVEATPDRGTVIVRGYGNDHGYRLTVSDSGVGIPDADKEFIFEGFYPVQETDLYSSGRPYSFNAGGQGIDLLRIKMFSEMHGFGLSFDSRRCGHLLQTGSQCPGDVSKCSGCTSPEDCVKSGRAEFTVDLQIVG